MELPEGRKAFPSHWVYKIKPDRAGNVQRLKARLLCGGNHQIEGINYEGTYALTARLGYVRSALAIVAKLDVEILQLHICMAFVGAELEEEIYMHPPQGYFLLVQTGRKYKDQRSETSQKILLRLRKSHYGLK